jgi:hypothetical protein
MKNLVMKNLRCLTQTLACSLLMSAPSFADSPLIFKPGSDAKGPGVGKKVVILTGDDEYRSEEAGPMLAQILSKKHGFHCFVVMAVDLKTGNVNCEEKVNLPGLVTLKYADACIMMWRFRQPQDGQMPYFTDYMAAGKPLIALRTSTHAFEYADPVGQKSRFAKYCRKATGEWPGGWGQQVIGDTWCYHHGKHGEESTMSIIEPSAKDHPILRGVGPCWGTTDVYGFKNLPSDITILQRGQVLSGMTEDSAPVAEKNNPMQPLAWTREYKNPEGKTNTIIYNSMGAATDLLDEDLRRFVVNSVYYGLKLEVPEKADVSITGTYQPTEFGFGKGKKGLKPDDFIIK